ncbi:DUF927 domain-containing protein [Tractidigestivibacter sp.]|uniref:phage NrS-1 polymerase family protein n=1 Tax=Tractidigestivibacter sp. TaxID=2847320 RepID=UPI002A918726|nr:DUF927 domain-containing protein [Tractidigestivibacter sp.]MDY5271663.1 DUF927 domain-containing protein [Tractidigestivibacter sp.]
MTERAASSPHGTGSLADALARVPRELKQEPRWVCWRREERNGKATKLPVDAHTGRMAKSTDPATRATFEEAVAAVGRWRCDGVGFVFGPDRAFTGLDLDHVISDGALDPAYRWVVEEAGTYTEVSPSGDGLHLIFRGAKPDWAQRSRKGQPGGRVVEMYDHDRYFTVTGSVFEGRGALAENPGVVERTYRTWIEPEARSAQPRLDDAAREASTGDMGDDELVERMLASRSGGDIRALLAGDCSAQGGDHSAADMALCSHLAFWCAGDAARMDRIFRHSGLMRDKWDSRRGGTTYGAQTIERAISGATEFYRPRAARRDGSSRSRNIKNVCSIPTRRERQGVPDGDGDPEQATEGAPSVEGWHVDERGRLWAADAAGELRYTVTATAPWIACDLVDVDTGDVRVAVAGGARERALDRDVLLNQSRIIGALTPLGANVSSTNAKDIVRYLTDCERRCAGSRPRARSVVHLGWAEGPLSAFMPYDAGGEVRFDPSPDEAVKARPFMEPAGTLPDWVAGMAPARAASPAFRCVMAASFASPLVALLGVQTFIVYLWGRSRSGKTPTLKAAGSVWGDPTEGSDSYFRTFADTPKSIVRAAALFHDIPVIIDELQSKGAPGGQASKRQIVEDLLYSLSLGHERGALNSDRSMMRAGSWRSLTIATGEIPIVGESTQQGAANRTLELNAEPFADVRQAQAMHHLVAREHGTAGRAFVEALRRNPAEFYARQFAQVRDAVSSIACGHPQADNVALLAFADALEEFYVFSPGSGWQGCLDGALAMAAWALGNATGSEGGDTDLKAIQFLAEWLVGNRIHFDDYCENDRLERWGAVEDKSCAPGFLWYVFSSVLERALAGGNFDRQKTLRRMAEEGLLVCDSGHRYTKQKRFRNAGRVYCVCIDNEALEAFLERAATGAGAAVIASQGGAPC